MERPITFAARTFATPILRHLPLQSMDQVLNEKAVGVSQGMVKLVRELGGMVADKQAELEIPY